MTAPLRIIAQAIREARMANGLLAAGWLSEHEVDIVARAVLAALAAAGIKLWEREPTVLILDAIGGVNFNLSEEEIVTALRAAWDAAPPTPTDGEQG